MYNAMEVNLRDLMHAMCYVHGVTSRYANDGTDAYVRYYVRYDIMQTLLFCGVRYCTSYVPEKPGPGSSHANSPGGSTVTHVGHVWESTMYPPRLDKARA